MLTVSAKESEATDFVAIIQQEIAACFGDDNSNYNYVYILVVLIT